MKDNKGNIFSKKRKKNYKRKRIDDTLSITMELERTLIPKEKDKEEVRHIQYTEYTDTLDGTVRRMKPVSEDEINKYRNNKSKGNKTKGVKSDGGSIYANINDLDNDKRPKSSKRWILFVVLIALISAGLYGITKIERYKADSVAIEALHKVGSVKVTKSKGYILFQPRKGVSKKAVIFFAQKNVQPESYTRLIRQISDKGYDVFLLDHKSIFTSGGSSVAQSIPERFDGYKSFSVIAVGDSVNEACKMVARNKFINNVVLIAGYPIDNELKLLDKRVCVIWGSKDSILNLEEFIKAKANLPSNTQYNEIEGANHSQFGDYGTEKGDSAAIINASEQIMKTGEIISSFLE